MTVNNILIFVASMTIVGYAQAQVISYGSCPSYVRVMPSFDVSQYLGTWYEYAKYPNSFANGVCISAEYTLQDDGKIGFNNSQINATTGELGGIIGSATVVSNGKLLVKFPVGPPPDVSSNYWVLGTDYTSYAVVYSCRPLPNNQHSTFAWILTRQRLPTTATINYAANVLTRNYISLDPLVRTNQQICNSL